MSTNHRVEFRIWVIDDMLANVTMIERSFPPAVQASSEIRSFLKAREALAHFDTLISTAPEQLPDFILLDFFLDHMYGHQLLDHFLEQYRASGQPPAVIIAHSSMAEANTMLVERGADCALEKYKGSPESSTVARAFRSLEALRWFKQHRRPQPEHA
jgi:CheY-like chemotaxis protein